MTKNAQKNKNCVNEKPPLRAFKVSFSFENVNAFSIGEALFSE